MSLTIAAQMRHIARGMVYNLESQWSVYKRLNVTSTRFDNHTCANFTSSQSHTCKFHIFTITHVQISHLHNYTCANFTSSQSHMCKCHSFTITHVQVSQLHIDVLHPKISFIGMLLCFSSKSSTSICECFNDTASQSQMCKCHSFTITHVQVSQLHIDVIHSKYHSLSCS